jgi:hypothetical protein
MPFPRWLARVNSHFTNRLLGPLARRAPGMGVIVYVGRKTGASVSNASDGVSPGQSADHRAYLRTQLRMGPERTHPKTAATWRREIANCGSSNRASSMTSNGGTIPDQRPQPRANVIPLPFFELCAI